jgi:lipopolysaccharide export system protein LptA
MTLLLALWLISAIPTVDTGTISSSNASYDGSGLVLKGQVVLDHGLGTMHAEEASLQKQEVGQSFPFSLIHLAGQVFLKLHNNAELRCDSAELDFGILKGALTSSSRVIYNDTLKKKKGAPVTFQLLGKTVDLQFVKKTESNYDIQNVLAHDNVELTYAGNYVLTTDAVFYQKELVDPANNEFRSHLSSHGSEKCKLSHLNNNVEADRFDLDIVHSKLILANPKGVLSSLSKGEVAFSSDALVWDNEKNTVILKGNPSIQEPNLGTISTDQEIHLFQKENQLTGFKSYGTTTLAYLNKHHLVSHGTLSFDRDKHAGTVDSPFINGSVPAGLQLYYEEGDMGVYADKANIEYSEENGAFQPVSLALKGNVKISSKSQDRCGIADRLSYNPTTRTFILGADPGKKVLFIHEQENIRISAQEVHITQDPETKKQTVKGIGNVQLALTNEEQLILNKHFNYAKQPAP